MRKGGFRSPPCTPISPPAPPHPPGPPLDRGNPLLPLCAVLGGGNVVGGGCQRERRGGYRGRGDFGVPPAPPYPPERGDPLLPRHPQQRVEDVAVTAPLGGGQPANRGRVWGEKGGFRGGGETGTRRGRTLQILGGVHLPSAVMRMRATSAGVPTKAPAAPAVMPMAALARKGGGVPSAPPRRSSRTL